MGLVKNRPARRVNAHNSQSYRHQVAVILFRLTLFSFAISSAKAGSTTVIAKTPDAMKNANEITIQIRALVFQHAIKATTKKKAVMLGIVFQKVELS